MKVRKRERRLLKRRYYLKRYNKRMNYRYLLKQYIKHVGEIEGVSYIDQYSKSDFFSDSEWNEMLELDKEVVNELNLEKEDLRQY